MLDTCGKLGRGQKPTPQLVRSQLVYMIAGKGANDWLPTLLKEELSNGT